MHTEPLSINDILYSLERLIAEFGAENSTDTVSDTLTTLSSRELDEEQKDRLDKIKTLCGI